VTDILRGKGLLDRKRRAEMLDDYELETGEWFASEHTDGAFPPELWVCSGGHDGELGVYVGYGTIILGFIAESSLDAKIAGLRSEGQDDLADVLEDIRSDVTDLRNGKQTLMRDLAGRRIRSC